MFILNLATQFGISINSKFTFHYVSIKSLIRTGNVLLVKIYIPLCFY